MGDMASLTLKIHPPIWSMLRHVMLVQQFVFRSLKFRIFGPIDKSSALISMQIWSYFTAQTVLGRLHFSTPLILLPLVISDAYDWQKRKRDLPKLRPI